MKKPTKKDAMANLSRAITGVVWSKLIVKHNGERGLARNDEVMAQEYRDELRKLPTNDLRFILKCHRTGVFLRADVTIDAITSELFERTLLRSKKAKGKPK